MAKTWGSLTWNVGNWGSQADSTVSVTWIVTGKLYSESS